MGKIKDHYFKEINSDADVYEKYLEEIEIARWEAEHHVMSAFEIILEKLTPKQLEELGLKRI